MRLRHALLSALLATAGPGHVQSAPAAPAPGAIVQMSAAAHPMHYLLSLPTGWSPEHSWPIVLVEESAEKDFRNAMQRYVAARKDLPFILVMPYSVILGRSGQRNAAVYPYSAQVWDRIDSQGACKFELDGIAALLEDVRSRYHGEPKAYVTGLEAGAHLVWALAFRRPEQLAAAAPVAGNFRNRCLEDGRISADPARTALPVQAFVGAQDEVWRRPPLHDQFLAAQALGRAHGYGRIGETVVPGRGHEALAPEVFAWFMGLRSKALSE